MNNLTETQAVLLKKISKLVSIIALFLLISSLILVFIGNLLLEPVIYFPIMLSLILLFYNYKLNITLKENYETISYFKLKLILLSLSRSIFITITYLGLVTKDYFYTIVFLFLSISALTCEIFFKMRMVSNKHVAVKPIKNQFVL